MGESYCVYKSSSPVVLFSGEGEEREEDESSTKKLWEVLDEDGSSHNMSFLHIVVAVVILVFIILVIVGFICSVCCLCRKR